MDSSLTYSVEKLTGENIVISKAFQSWGLDHMAPFVDDMLARLDQLDEDVMYIADLRDWSFAFDDLVGVANAASRQSNALLKHPRIIEFIVVSESKVVGMAAKGLQSDIFGNIPSTPFQSMEVALDYARSILAGSS